MRIKVLISNIIHNNHALEITGLNPYCMNEGCNDDWIEVEVNDDIEYDILESILK